MVLLKQPPMILKFEISQHFLNIVPIALKLTDRFVKRFDSSISAPESVSSVETTSIFTLEKLVQRYKAFEQLLILILLPLLKYSIALRILRLSEKEFLTLLTD